MQCYGARISSRTIELTLPPTDDGGPPIPQRPHVQLHLPHMAKVSGVCVVGPTAVHEEGGRNIGSKAKGL